MNILITCSLGDFMPGTVKCIKEAYPNAYIVGVDVDEMHVVADYLDKFYRVSKSNDPGYVQEILDICIFEKIDVVIPIHTFEIDTFSENIKKFDDIGVVVASNKKNLNIVNKKDMLYQFMAEHDIKYAKFFVLNDKISATRVLAGQKNMCIKQPYGCGGRGFYKFEDGLIDNMTFPCIAQQYLCGDEYTVDCFCHNGKVMYYCVKLNYEMENGVAVKAVTVDNYEIAKDCIKICEMLDLDGCIGFDLKADENGVAYIIDCNPRLTATISLSCTIGVNFVECLIKNAIGDKIPVINDFKYGVHILRKKVDYFYE